MSEASLSRSAVADRNLLCGILALQMDFLSRDALITAMHAWVLDKSKPLGEILLTQGQLSPERLQLLEALVAEHLKAHQNDPQQGLVALTASPPPIPAELREIADDELHASLAAVGSVRATTGDASIDQRPSGENALGLRYRILRFHAKGGLGEVFIAEDQELHREVALKEIQATHAEDPRSRGRFLLEAEITGKLEHPGIVPVYGLGQYPDGRPFYAMRFVKGDNLKEAIQRFHEADRLDRDPGERSLALRQLLGRFVDVCNAVAYAHSRGILHRDLKPGNILLGKYGETLVADWGLAKVVGRSEPARGDEELTLRPSLGSGTTETQMGSAVGTPKYMSPEQAAGRLELLGPASDIYSLGATLYTLLTGQAPVAGQDKEEVLQRVQRGQVKPPRQVKPSTPAALEAVCLKAMLLKPHDRYATALDLSADIEHWLADEPVTAYREPWTTRVRRLVKRHRTLVTGAAAALLAVLLLGGGGWWWWEQERVARRADTVRRVNEALDEAKSLSGQAKAAPASSLARWNEALAAARRAETALDAGEEDEESRRRVRDLLAELNREIAAARQAAEDAHKDRLMVERLAGLRTWKGKLIAEVVEFVDHDRAYASAFRDYGIDVQHLPPAEAARRMHQRPIRIELAAALDDWSLVSGKAREKDPWLRQRLLEVARDADADLWRVQLRTALLKDDRDSMKRLAASPEVLQQAAPTLHLLALGLGHLSGPEAAVALLRKAQQQHPGDFWINVRLADFLGALKPPRREEQVRYYTAALAVHPDAVWINNSLGVALVQIPGRLEEAIDAFHKIARLEGTSVTAHCNLGYALWMKGDFDKAIVSLETAIRLQPDAALAHTLLGACLAGKGEVKKALGPLQKAVELLPGKAKCHVNLGTGWLRNQELDKAIAAYQEAIRLQPDLPSAHSGLANAWENKGQIDKAMAEYRQTLRFQPSNADAWFHLGKHLAARGATVGAMDAMRQAIHCKPDFAEAYCNLGKLLEGEGRLAEALPLLERGDELGSRQPGWRYPSEKWVTDCKRYLELDKRLPAVLRGETKPADITEYTWLAVLCQVCKRCPGIAARLYQEAFAMLPSPAEDQRFGLRYLAARNAVGAGCGVGREMPPYDAKARAAWRKQALDWLRADLSQWAKEMDKGNSKASKEAREKLLHWQKDVDLTGVREEKELAKLPEAEQQAWRQFWAEVTAVLERAKATK
jgi:serine/threonine-protein kinase